MLPISITLVKLGNLRYLVDVNFLKNWKSEIIKISEIKEVSTIEDAKGMGGEGMAGNFRHYTDGQLENIIQKNPNSNLTIGLIGEPLQEDYYLRPLKDETCVISLHEMGRMMQMHNFTIESYILRNVYRVVTAWVADGSVIIQSGRMQPHDFNKCLFDYNWNKADILLSMDSPPVCQSCKEKLAKKALPNNFLPILDKDLSRIRKALYFRIIDWIKSHPLISVSLAVLGALLLNVAGNIIYELGKGLIPK